MEITFNVSYTDEVKKLLGIMLDDTADVSPTIREAHTTELAILEEMTTEAFQYFLTEADPDEIVIDATVKINTTGEEKTFVIALMDEADLFVMTQQEAIEIHNRNSNGGCGSCENCNCGEE